MSRRLSRRKKLRLPDTPGFWLSPRGRLAAHLAHFAGMACNTLARLRAGSNVNVHWSPNPHKRPTFKRNRAAGQRILVGQRWVQEHLPDEWAAYCADLLLHPERHFAPSDGLQ